MTIYNAEQLKTVRSMRNQMQDILHDNILSFWLDRMTDPNGGFYGRISGDGRLYERFSKGAILNARILWTFSAAFRLTGRSEYRDAATRAFRYLADKFYDRTYGGVYWSLDFEGRPEDRKKQIYALGFAIYGLSEYNRATGNEEALDLAVKLFCDIEAHSFDKTQNGYFEAFGEDWSEIGDVRLSEKDENERKTMNTHLHIIEPYTNLYRVWKDESLRKALENLLYIFTEKILDPHTGHLGLFFDDSWHSKYPLVSYGHDIEASWLLHETALVLGDEAMLAKLEPIVRRIAEAASEGFLTDGGMIYEMNTEKGSVDADRHWWVQAETVVGYFNLWQHFGDGEALEKSAACWEFIKRHLIDNKGGEWFWSLKADGSINTLDDKAGFWKCPYHNGRMCLEIIERMNTISKGTEL